MRVVKKLYVGELAKKEKKSILRGLEKKQLQPFVYLITIPLNGNAVLDILPAFTLKYPFFYSGKEENLTIVGIAKGRQEAFQLTAGIAMDTYKATGGFDVGAFLG